MKKILTTLLLYLLVYCALNSKSKIVNTSYNGEVSYDRTSYFFSVTEYVNPRFHVTEESCYKIPLLKLSNVHKVDESSQYSIYGILNRLSLTKRPELYVWNIYKANNTVFFTIYDSGFVISSTNYKKYMGCFILNDKAFLIYLDELLSNTETVNQLFQHTNDSVQVKLKYEPIENFYYMISDTTTTVEGVIQESLIKPIIFSWENKSIYNLIDSVKQGPPLMDSLD